MGAGKQSTQSSTFPALLSLYSKSKGYIYHIQYKPLKIVSLVTMISIRNHVIIELEVRHKQTVWKSPPIFRQLQLPRKWLQSCNNNSLQQQICWFNLGWVHILVFSNKKKKKQRLLQIFYASGLEQSLLSWRLLTWGRAGLHVWIVLETSWESSDLNDGMTLYGQQWGLHCWRK